MIEFRMPSLGADMEAGTLVEWLVKPGDPVKRGDIIAMVDTQKGLFDIEVFDEGKIEQLIIKEGEKVPVGTVMALIHSEKEVPQKTEAVPVAQKTIAEKPVVEKAGKPEPILSVADHPHGLKVSPLARRIAEEKGVDLSAIKGTGEEGAIIKQDVEQFIAKKTTVSKERSEATAVTIRTAVAAAMSRSNREIPHYYLEMKIDLSRAMEWLTETNKERPVKQRLLPVVLFIKAVAKALVDVPQLNGHWENGLQLKELINIGFVVSLRTGGILIPAIPEADKKTLDEIMDWLNEAIPRTRAMKLRSSDVTDTSVTITSLGEGGAEAVYGVIYPPQVALVGIGSISQQPWASDGMLGVRPVVTVTLAADHRATDGQTGSRFLTALQNYLQKPAEL